VPVGVGVGVEVGVGVGVEVLVGVGVGVGVVSSTITSSSAGPQTPGVVLDNVSVVVAPALGDRLAPSVCDIQPGFAPVMPAALNWKPWLLEPKLAFSVFSSGEDGQVVMLVLAASANVTL
jgi:hypothetical protein